MNVLSIGDIHLGNSNTPFTSILAGLYNAIPDNDETGKLDVIFIVGDIFDKLIMLPDAPVLDIQLWITQLLRICKRRNIILRVLEGTPSHDRGQGMQFIAMDRVGEIGANVRYVDTLSIEHISELDIDVLYLPDEWHHDHNDTWVDVTKLLTEHGLDKVDFILMHGQFEHQMPAHLNLPCHVAERYISIVRYFIFVGHIHFMSIYKCILAAGSFDCISHGEEGDKGHFRVSVCKGNENNQIKFVKNELATNYSTIDCLNLELADSLKLIEDTCTIPKGSHIRILCERYSDIAASIDLLKDKYPDYHWKTKQVTNDTTSTTTTDKVKYQAVSITKNNISQMINNKLVLRETEDHVKVRALELLAEII